VGNHGAQDCLLVRLSSTGSVLWEKCLGGEGNDQLLRDGRIAGQAAPVGTYVYQIRMGFADGTQQQIRGTLVLVR